MFAPMNARPASGASVARDDRDTVLVGDDVDLLHPARGRHRRVDGDGDRDDRAVLRDEWDVELDGRGTVLDSLAAEETLQRLLDTLVLAEGLPVRGPRRRGKSTGGDDAEGTQ